jgi:hypothetical protein
LYSLLERSKLMEITPTRISGRFCRKQSTNLPPKAMGKTSLVGLSAYALVAFVRVGRWLFVVFERQPPDYDGAG